MYCLIDAINLSYYYSCWGLCPFISLVSQRLQTCGRQSPMLCPLHHKGIRVRLPLLNPCIGPYTLQRVRQPNHKWSLQGSVVHFLHPSEQQ